jgi:hypothetical protein
MSIFDMISGFDQVRINPDDARPGMSLYHHYLAVRDNLTTLRRNKFYLSRNKFFVDMENEGLDLLGRHIQNCSQRIKSTHSLHCGPLRHFKKSAKMSVHSNG